MTDEDLAGLVVRLRLQGSDDARVEAKAAAGDTPKSLWSTVSAFANTDGGTVILGLDEGTGFAPAGYLALAASPQQRLPQLTVDVAVHPATAESQRADLRFVDRQTCDGVLCENQGSGVPRMIAAMRDQGLPAPDYSASSISQVVVRLSRFGLLIGSWDGPYVLTRLERSAEVSGACWEVLSVLDTTADKSIHDIARTTGKSLDALRPRLRELAADRLVVATAPPTSRNRSYLLST